MSVKSLTLRLDEDLHDMLREIAEVNGSSVAHEIRQAVVYRVWEQKRDRSPLDTVLSGKVRP